MAGWATSQYQVIAHKGDSSRFPENTASAIESAIKIGCNVIEVDVSVTRDGYSIALHGPTLEKSTSGYGNAKEYSWNDLQGISARGPDGKITSEKISLVENLLRTFGSKTKWNLDLKEGGIGNDLIQAIRELGLVSNIVLSGLKLTNARDVLMANPDFNVLVNLSKVDQFFVATKLLSRLYIKYRFKALKKEPSVIALNMHHRYASKSIIREVHKLGLEIWVYTVDDTDLFNKLFQEGVDSVTTNSPSEVLNTFRL
jgi:glycerophosphoryl diester phosphodiesterase